MQIFTIGFTRKSAQQFFRILSEAGVRRVLDVRLHNASQLAGFTKLGDLEYFLRQILGVDYLHLPLLAPTQELFEQRGDWTVYQARFSALLAARKVEDQLDRATFDRACLLCSESSPDHCHRRLAAEYLQRKWGNLEIRHL